MNHKRSTIIIKITSTDNWLTANYNCYKLMLDKSCQFPELVIQK